MGQANAARDKLYDLRQCKLSGANANGFDLSGVIMTDTDLSNAKLVESYFSKGYLRGTLWASRLTLYVDLPRCTRSLTGVFLLFSPEY
jgi:uncharacterized protein YjbI with pentapeptide repeats